MNDKLQETVISYHNNVDSKSLIDKVQIDVCGVFLLYLWFTDLYILSAGCCVNLTALNASN